MYCDINYIATLKIMVCMHNNIIYNIVTFLLNFGYGYGSFKVGMRVEINSGIEFQWRQTLGSGFIKATWRLTSCSCTAAWRQSISQSWSMVVCSPAWGMISKGMLTTVCSYRDWKLPPCIQIANCFDALHLYIKISACMWILEWKCRANIRFWKSIFHSSHAHISLLLVTITWHCTHFMWLQSRSYMY